MEHLMNELLYALRDCAELGAKLRTLDDAWDNSYVELENAASEIDMATNEIIQLMRKYINGDAEHDK